MIVHKRRVYNLWGRVKKNVNNKRKFKNVNGLKLNRLIKKYLILWVAPMSGLLKSKMPGLKNFVEYQRERFIEGSPRFASLRMFGNVVKPKEVDGEICNE
jgi:hypothetical protein